MILNNTMIVERKLVRILKILYWSNFLLKKSKFFIHQTTQNWMKFYNQIVIQISLKFKINILKLINLSKMF